MTEMEKMKGVDLPPLSWKVVKYHRYSSAHLLADARVFRWPIQHHPPCGFSYAAEAFRYVVGLESIKMCPL